MSFGNSFLWHVDHKIPNSYAKNVKDSIYLNHYLNLQPLWAEDNLSKNNKTSDNIEEEFLLLKKMVDIDRACKGLDTVEDLVKKCNFH